MAFKSHWEVCIFLSDLVEDMQTAVVEALDLPTRHSISLTSKPMRKYKLFRTSFTKFFKSCIDNGYLGIFEICCESLHSRKLICDVVSLIDDTVLSLGRIIDSLPNFYAKPAQLLFNLSKTLQITSLMKIYGRSGNSDIIRSFFSDTNPTPAQFLFSLLEGALLSLNSFEISEIILRELEKLDTSGGERYHRSLSRIIAVDRLDILLRYFDIRAGMQRDNTLFWKKVITRLKLCRNGSKIISYCFSQPDLKSDIAARTQWVYDLKDFAQSNSHGAFEIVWSYILNSKLSLKFEKLHHLALSFHTATRFGNLEMMKLIISMGYKPSHDWSTRALYLLGDYCTRVHVVEQRLLELIDFYISHTPPTEMVKTQFVSRISDLARIRSARVLRDLERRNLIDFDVHRKEYISSLLSKAMAVVPGSSILEEERSHEFIEYLLQKLDLNGFPEALQGMEDALGQGISFIYLYENISILHLLIEYIPWTFLRTCFSRLNAQDRERFERLSSVHRDGLHGISNIQRLKLSKLIFYSYCSRFYHKIENWLPLVASWSPLRYPGRDVFSLDELTELARSIESFT